MAKRKDKTIGEKMDNKKRKWRSRRESNTQHERMKMTHEMWGAHAKVTTWATRVRVWSTRKCDVWGVLFTHTVGCSRLLSAVNDLTTTKKKSCKVSLLSSFVKKSHNGSLHSICRSFTTSDVLAFWWFFNEFHQESFHCHQDVLDEDDGCHFWYFQEGIGASRSSPDSRWRRCNFVMLRWGLNGVSSVHCVQMCWERSTNSSCIWSIRQTTCDRWYLSARPWPSGCILLQFDQFWIASHEMLNLSGSGREFLHNSFWCISFSNYGQYGVLFVLQSSHDDCHDVAPSQMT